VDSLATGTTGVINGNMSFASATGTAAHKLLAKDANAVTFQSGSIFTAGTGLSGNPFGVSNLNSIIFAAGSEYIFISGSNPFGASQPSSVVTFLAGSLFSQQTTGTPSFSGRTYANFEMNIPSGTITVTGGSKVQMDSLIMTAGTLNFNMTGTPGHLIRGNINLKSGTVLNFTPASAGTVNITGTAQQIIYGSGSISMTNANSTVVVGNTSGVLLKSNLTVTLGTLTVNGILDCTNSVISGTGVYTLSSGATMKTANTGGIDATVIVSGTKTYNSAANYEFNGTSSQVTGASLTACNNLTINNPSGVTLSSSCTVGGNLSLTNGTFSIGTSTTLTVNGGITASLGSLTGGLNSGLYVGGTGSGFTIPAITVGSLTVNRANGVILSGNVTVTNSLILTNGPVFTGSNTLEVDNQISGSSSFSNANMIVLDDGTNFGALKLKTGNTGTNYSFPVGDTRTNTYSPVYLNFTGGTSLTSFVTLTMKALKDPNNFSISNYLNRAWTFNGTGFSGNPVYNMELDYSAGDVQGSEASLYFGQFTSGSWMELNQPDPIAHKFNQNSISGFGIFTAGEAGAMPVLISSFRSNVTGNNVILNWTTTYEINNSGFEVQRKIKSSNAWIKAGFVNGKGTTNNQTNYSYEDLKLNSGSYQYRLKQIDYNGNFEYFSLPGIVAVDKPGKFNLFQSYPNPSNPKAKIDFQVPEDGQVSLKIYDLSGREVVILIDGFLKADYYAIDFDGTNLASGVYVYVLSAGNNYRQSKKLILLK